jgi:hypothetical protein
LKRINTGKRLHSKGFLRFRVFFYKKTNPDKSEIINIFNDDLGRPVNIIIIIKIRLQIRFLKRFIKRFCRAAKISNKKNIII